VLDRVLANSRHFQLAVHSVLSSIGCAMPRLRHYVGPCWPLDATAYDYVRALCPSDLAWEFLRRNPEYQRDYRLHRRGTERPRQLKSGQWLTRVRRAPALAGKWGVYPFCRSDIAGAQGRR